MPKKRKKVTIIFFIVLLFLSIWGKEKLSNKIPEEIPFTHGTLTDKDANLYFQTVILPIIQGASRDPIPEIGDIIQSLHDLEKSGKVEVGIASTYRDDSLVATHPSPDGKMLWITFSGPRLMDYQNNLSPDAFKDLVILGLCHETLHLLYDPVFTQGLYRQGLAKQTMDELRLKGETLVWSLTVQKFIRPMIQAKRNVRPAEMAASEAFAGSDDNPKDPQWIKWVYEHRFTVSD